MEKIRILLVDDHQVVRKGLQTLFHSEPGLEVVGSIESGNKALEFLQHNEVDVLVSDVTMPDMNGIELVRKMKPLYPHIRAMFLTMHLDEGYIIDGIDAGAKGYVVKDASEQDIIEAVKSVNRDEMFLTQKVSDILAKNFIKSSKVSQQTENTQALTKREKEILKCIVNGLSNKMVGAELSISESTVNAHRYNLMKKLNAKNSADLVRMTLEHKLIN